MPVARTHFGSSGGNDVHLYTLTNARGFVARITNFGGIVTELYVPDRNGQLDDVVLGFDSLEKYIGAHPYFGATVGRVGNRIRGAAFELDGRTNKLAANDGAHHLHGGARGWDKAVWAAEVAESPDGPTLKLSHVSADGDEGYPGTVGATTTYVLTHKGELRVTMIATSDKTTVVNMVHHTYWNLAGRAAGRPGDGGEAEAPRITDHRLRLCASHYTPGDPMVPTGEEREVVGTPFDFTAEKTIGRDLEAAGGTPVGYDHNFVVDGDPSALREVARLSHPTSGRVLTLLADQPGVQLYSGNFLDGTVVGKRGRRYGQHTGVCLETQKFPNAINVPGWRGQVVLNPGQTYKHTMVHRFTAE